MRHVSRSTVGGNLKLITLGVGMNAAVRKAGWAAILVAALATAACGSPAVESTPVATAHEASPVAAPQPVVNDCTQFPAQSVSRPSKILLACGDGGLWVKDIVWSSWGPDTAEGEGTQSRRKCVPDCASGGVETGPTHITLRKLQGNRFTEALIADLSGKPETWPL